jgi:hypothetical protein
MTEPRNDRRLLVNGEELSFSTDRPPRRPDKYHPKTLAEARDILQPQLAQVISDIEQIRPGLRAERVVIEAEVWANYLANSWFPQHLVQKLKLRPLGSRIVRDGVKITEVAGATTSISKSYLLSADADGVAEMMHLLNGSNNPGLAKAAEELRQFNEIKVSRAKERGASAGGMQAYEAVLHPDPDESTVERRVQASTSTLAKFASLVESCGGTVVNDADIIDGLTFISLQLPQDAVDGVSQFNPLRSLTPAPVMETLAGGVEAEDAGEVTVLRNAADLPKVLVFDGGVDDSGHVFRGMVRATDLTGRGLVDRYALHGSAVTGAVLYGDVASRGSFVEPAAYVAHYQVMPTPVPQDASEYPWILSKIREVVETTDARIVNLSLGPRVPVDDDEPHRWTAVLDKVAYDRGILFVTAAGNNGEKAGPHLNRVQVPGDMVNGLTVGASDSPDTSVIWAAADYSASGPGRSGNRIQPAVVSYGGTAMQQYGRIRPDGSIVHDDHGTSYSTPLVTNLMARLSRELGGRADAPTLRALAVHLAERGDDHDQTRAGHGRLIGDAATLLSCDSHEAMILYHGILGRTEVRAFPIPFPAAFEGGDIELSWTVAYSTATDAAEAGEYTNAGLEAVFRPHKDKRTMTFEPHDGPTRSHVVNVRTDGADIAARVAEGWSLPTAARSRPQNTTRHFEGDLRELGKWETIWHSTDNLRASSMDNPQIDINHLSREGGRITRNTEDIEFSLVVTMRSRAGKTIYDLVLNEFDVLAPLPVIASVSATVDIQADN